MSRRLSFGSSVWLCLTFWLLTSCSDGDGSRLTVRTSPVLSEQEDAPVVLYSVPAVTITFNEAVDPAEVAAGAQVFRMLSGGGRELIPCLVTPVPDHPEQFTLSLQDEAIFPPGEVYEISIPEGLSSQGGTAVSNGLRRYFATGYNFVPGPTEVEGLQGSRIFTICISDLHLGDSRSIAQGYGWMQENRVRLSAFLDAAGSAPNVREVVLNGDILEEWVAPMSVHPFAGGSEVSFLQDVVQTNQAVTDILKNIISTEQIRVVYIPGNHDMLVSEAIMEQLFPGIIQARDVRGLGAYTPEDLPEVLIEHGHRYDFFNAPDPLSNRDLSTHPDAILPPGFFVSRMAISSQMNKSAFAPLKAAGPADNYQYNLYRQAWSLIMNNIPVSEDPSEKIIVTGIDGYAGPYAINDLVPQRNPANGRWDVVLFKGIEDTWPQRQNANLVRIPTGVQDAMMSGVDHTYLDAQADRQFFRNSGTGQRVVIFGHSHQPLIQAGTNLQQKKTVYANSGTWTDGAASLNFVLVAPGRKTDSAPLFVVLYEYHPDGTVTRVGQEVLLR